MDNVNRLLFKDTGASGSFATLFYLELDQQANSIRWIRAGHDPAFVINCQTGEFSELRGAGVALGVDPDWNSVSNELPLTEVPQVILICSDGIFEATNEYGEPFGKQRIYELLPDITELSSEKAANRIIQEIQSFVKETTQHDDITVAVLRTSSIS